MMTPLTNLARNRHRTAISRTDYSHPISSALADGLIHGDATAFDYGCGLGDDVRHPKRRGINSWGWDPTHRSAGKRESAQVVNLVYVVNVIEDVEERAKCLAHVWSYARKALIVSARLASQTRDFTPASRYGDGYVTSIETFQKHYEQRELKAWPESQLGESTVAAGPGIFYVCRDASDRMGFLASRHSRRSRASLPLVASSIDEHKELLRSVIEFFEEHVRAPVDDELDNAELIQERFGSLRRAFRLIERAHDPERWDRTITARGQDLLLFLAQSRFDGLPRLGQLPLPLRRDIESLFSTYRGACDEVDLALYAVGDIQRVRRVAQHSPVGKRMPSAIHAHESALQGLPPILRRYEGCARRYIGRVKEANVINLLTEEPMVSYLFYPHFETDPHPALAASVTVHLQTFRLRDRDYRTSSNPPILHRKEPFVLPDHPLQAKFARLTRQEEAKGLFEEASRIGTRHGWEQLMIERGFALKGHRVVRQRGTSQPGAYKVKDPQIPASCKERAGTGKCSSVASCRYGIEA